ncbi:uncharacterized protein LOC123290811 isoform X2 [Chrysoperla carnea]|uniref:uncharacterized protein LOC123290811 isoform X2 n=1 Tax=Chrysoperla carnea TaxID=189513 RepID=UPI001D075AD5|nr:uncharacterized protein LOC123290811 isoform X2 [Chrysoperla carnea]
MARAGTARHRGRNAQGHSEGGDDVQRSLELLDRVLSEFDDIENANQMLQQQALLSGGTTTVVTSSTEGSGSNGDVDETQQTNTGGTKGVVITKRDIDPGNTTGVGNVSSTPEDDSPSLGGHQSEDDGYMSMNGRKAKFALTFNPVSEVIMQAAAAQHQEVIPSSDGTNNTNIDSSNIIIPSNIQQQTTTTVEMDFPPPPEEAERLIATLLPRVSPGNSAKRSVGRRKNNNKTRTEILTSPLSQFHKYNNVECMVNGDDPAITAATQTTLPQTRHQRPYGWDRSNSEGFHLHQINPKKMGQRYASLPYDSRNNPVAHIVSPLNIPRWVPPRTVPGASERHREVCRRHNIQSSNENLSAPDNLDNNLRPLNNDNDAEHFSDDSLEEQLPPPPPQPCSKRSSIAWEVSIGDDECVDDPLLTPGSTKVVRRRRRKSNGDQLSHSSTSSIPNRCLRDLDLDWPDPPPCSTEDEIISPFSDSDDPVILPDDVHSSDFSNNSGTYVIRRGRNKERKPLLQNLNNSCQMSTNSNLSLNSRLSSDLSIPHSRYSTDWNNSSILFSRELITPNSRVSIDLSTPTSRQSHELNSPKSRYSLDLNMSSRDSSSFQQHLSQSHSSSRRSSDPNYITRSCTPNQSRTQKHSTTFDNIKSLMKEGGIERTSYTPSGPEDDDEDISGPIYNHHQIIPPNLVRVVSLPTLTVDEFTPRRELTVTVEEEEDIESPRQQNSMSPLRKVEENISALLERQDLDVSKLRLEDRNYKDTLQLNLKSHKAHMEIPNLDRKNRKNRNEDDGGTPKSKRNGIQKSESAKEMLLSHNPSLEDDEPGLTNSNSVDFPVRVEILQHEFPPLPPSPVEEDDDEYQEIANPKRADTLPIHTGDSPPAVPPHRGGSTDTTNSLKTRSMDAEFSRGYRNNYSSRQTTTPTERRTLPTDLLPGTTRRRTFLKRASQSPSESSSSTQHHMQTSCSLPETPIFARGCDIPRTPHRRAPEVPTTLGSSSRTAPRQSSTMGTLNTIGSSAAYRRTGASSTGLEQAMVGAELLRLAGGPGRGWYPRHRQHTRPASIEHLDRLAPGHLGSNPWDCNSKKPLTLPPNLTPKFYQRSPREALRRVTSLLIRKGNNGKENSKKDKDTLSPSGNSVNGCWFNRKNR